MNLKGIAVGLMLAMAALVVPASESKEELSRSEAIELLRGSVAELTEAGGNPRCSAAKVGTKQYLTARHCLEGLASYEQTSLRVEHGSDYKSIRSWTVSTQEGEDWALLNVSEEDAEIPMLHLGCGDEVKQGDNVATMGFPLGLPMAYAEGYVSTTEKPTSPEGYPSTADIWVVLSSGPGASGSPVISMKTGRVLGVLVEGTQGPDFMGFESIQGLDVCEDLSGPSL